MKHYVMGFVFNKSKNKVLLVEKKRPKWQAGKWNAIGGKIDDTDANPLAAMNRETKEETDVIFHFEHCITFVCPGGTVFVFRAFSMYETIQFTQMEDELLQVWELDRLPAMIDADLKWLLAVCLSTIKFPFCVHQTTLGE